MSPSVLGSPRKSCPDRTVFTERGLDRPAIALLGDGFKAGVLSSPLVEGHGDGRRAGSSWSCQTAPTCWRGPWLGGRVRPGLSACRAPCALAV